MTSQSDQSADPIFPIPIRNVWHMLIYAWQLTTYKDIGKYGTEPSPNLLGLLTKILVESTELLLKQQMGREYKETIAEVDGLKGRIRFSESIRYLINRQNKTVCAFNELTTDTPKNQIIRSTLSRLVKDKRLLSYSEPESKNMRWAIRRLVRKMDGVAFVQLSNALFSSIQLRRDNRNYILPLRICALIHQLRMPKETFGDSTLAELVRNKDGLPTLFEQFVRNFYRYQIGENYEVSSERLSWPDGGSELLPQMITDVSIKSKTGPSSILIIDTKFYQEALISRFGDQRFRSPHLYQIYAYLRTQEDRGSAFREAKGMLLYPTVGYEIDELIKVQGHSIRVVTINLSDPWEQIETRLLSFV